jgi:hypothetical protein
LRFQIYIQHICMTKAAPKKHTSMSQLSTYTLLSGQSLLDFQDFNWFEFSICEQNNLDQKLILIIYCYYIWFNFQNRLFMALIEIINNDVNFIA